MFIDFEKDICGLEHIHRHTHHSLLDGFATPAEYAEYSKEANQQYLCITDHGMMSVIPSQIRACDEYNLKPLFGCELYVNNNQPSLQKEVDYKAYADRLAPDDKDALRKSYHLLAVAATNEGYRNLVHLATWGFANGYGGVPRRPRVTHAELMAHKEGILFSSCCYLSEIGQAFDRQGPDAAEDMLLKYVGMFGKSFYLELMLLDFAKQKPYDAWLVKMHDKYHIPIIISQDCFVEGTLVSTISGYKCIEDIKVGDMVLTHRGRYRPVEVIGNRPVKEGEFVYEVKSNIGTYCFQATGNHKVYTAQHQDYKWKYQFKPVEELSKSDYLLIPKMDESDVFSPQELSHIDLFDLIPSTAYDIVGEDSKIKNGNMACRLKYDAATDSFISSKSWQQTHQTTIPRMLCVDDDFLKIVGWYMAEGWCEKDSNQVGFALHANEQDVADFIIGYFSKFGITAKTYRVTENGIAVRLSSIAFNYVFRSICGCGAANKQMPSIKGSWLKIWSRRQLGMILEAYWLGDGVKGYQKLQFASTSRILIFQIAQMLNACGVCSQPFCDRPNKADPRKKAWRDCWKISVTGSRYTFVKDVVFCGGVERFRPARKMRYIELDNYWAVPFKSRKPIVYDRLVYDIQVEEDHSFIANLYVSSNCHYCRKDHAKYQRYMLMTKTGNTIQDIERAMQDGNAEERFFELQDQNLWMKTEAEVNEKYAADYSKIIPYEIFCKAKRESVAFCRRAEGVTIDRAIKLPKLPEANEKLWEASLKGLKWRGLTNRRYYDQLRKEYELICRKDFSSYFLIVKMFTDEARRICPKILGWGNGDEALAPGRGSAVGFLTCYVLGITDVNPIKHKLLPERFLSDARGGRQMQLEFPGDPINRK